VNRKPMSLISILVSSVLSFSAGFGTSALLSHIDSERQTVDADTYNDYSELVDSYFEARYDCRNNPDDCQKRLVALDRRAAHTILLVSHVCETVNLYNTCHYSFPKMTTYLVRQKMGM
jgi:hypothetical protein